MSEKLDELAASINELKQNRRVDSMLMRGFMVACGAIMIYFITFMNTTSGRLSKIEAVLATKDNISKIREDMNSLESRINDKFDEYLSLSSYLAIENRRGDIVVNLFVDFGKIIGLKEEDLEYFRRKSVKELNGAIVPGVTRGGG